MKLFLLKIVLIVSAVLFLGSTAGAYYNPGTPTGFVNDYAGVLSTDQKQLLENKLGEFEKQSSHEITVIIIKDLQGDTIENFAENLFQEWGVGKKGSDNGVMILIAKDDRKMRIEVGYGLEGALTDAQASWIFNQIMKPAFQADNFYQGIDGAVDKIISATQGEAVPSQSSSGNKHSDSFWEGIIWLGMMVIMWLSAILARSKSWWLGGVIGAVVGVILGLFKGFMYFGLTSIAILIPVGLLFDYVVSKQYRTGKAKGHVPWWAGGGHFGGGSGGGGFGGFGGGMSGGGGSSGSW